MTIFLVTLITVLCLLAIEWIFHFGKWVRIILIALYLVVITSDAILSTQDDPHRFTHSFTLSILESFIPFVPWLCLSYWIRHRIKMRGRIETTSELK